jgi:hypothetical protein
VMRRGFVVHDLGAAVRRYQRAFARLHRHTAGRARNSCSVGHRRKLSMKPTSASDSSAAERSSVSQNSPCWQTYITHRAGAKTACALA